MNYKDLYNALQFFGVYDNIVIQVAKRQDVPLIKRYLIQSLREPDRMIGDVLYYSNKSNSMGRVGSISIRAVSNYASMQRYRVETMFYVGYQDSSDYSYLTQCGVQPVDTPYRSIDLWKVCNMSVSSMYQALQVDGHNNYQAIKILSECGVIPGES